MSELIPATTPATGLPPRFTDGLALFDLDRTLLPGSSLVPFGREVLRRGLVSRRVVGRHLVAAGSFQRRGLDDSRIERIQTSLLASIAGRSYDELACVAAEVGTHLATEVFPSARWLLRRHREAGDFCVILTAAPQELAAAIADGIGAHRAIGTRLEVDDGVFTGQLDGPFCHGPGKLERLERDLGACDLANATAYGDSASDLPVLERCGQPVAINPDRGLSDVARRRNWPVLRFS